MKINVKQLLSDKAPKLARFIPRFVIRYIERTIHQSEINEVLSKYGHLQGADFARAVIKYLNVDYNVVGAENIDKSGRYIIVANHPLGGLDGLILADEFNRIFGDAKFIVNDVLMNLAPLKSIFIPINKFGVQNQKYAKELNDVYSSDSQILIFPAGVCSRKIDGKIQDLPWRKNFIAKSIEYERDMLPVYVDAVNSNFFYNFSKFRMALGIKFNIELFFLPDEMFRKRNTNVNIVIGKPISYKTLTREKSHEQWAKELREVVFMLKNCTK